MGVYEQTFEMLIIAIQNILFCHGRNFSIHLLFLNIKLRKAANTLVSVMSLTFLLPVLLSTSQNFHILVITS